MSETTCTRNNPKKSLEPYFDYPWEMICNIGKYNWSMAVQIQFEKVDMAIKTDYFDRNWEGYHAKFAAHSLTTSGVFEWKTFKDGSEQTLT